MVEAADAEAGSDLLGVKERTTDFSRSICSQEALFFPEEDEEDESDDEQEDGEDDEDEEDEDAEAEEGDNQGGEEEDLADYVRDPYEKEAVCLDCPVLCFYSKSGMYCSSIPVCVLTV